MSHQDRVARIEAALATLLNDTNEPARWQQGAVAGVPDLVRQHAVDPSRGDVAALQKTIHERLTHRRSRGVGTLADRFPTVFRHWRKHGTDNALVARFSASSHGSAWRPVQWTPGGISLEEAFAQFVIATGIAPASTVHREMVQAIGRALVTVPNPLFRVPEPFTGEPGRWVAVLDGSPPELVAAVNGQLITGPITPLIAATLRGEPVHDTAAMAQLREALQKRGLLSPQASPAGAKRTL